MKYCLKPVNEPEREVTKEEYLAAATDRAWGFPQHLIPATFINGRMSGHIDEDSQEECTLREFLTNSPDDLLPTVEESLRRDIERIVDEATRTNKTKMVERLLKERRDR